MCVESEFLRKYGRMFRYNIPRKIHHVKFNETSDSEDSDTNDEKRFKFINDM